MILDHFPQLKGIILDMDGVLWHDTQPIGDLPVIFDFIRTHGLKVILATNNATHSIDFYVEKLKSFSVDICPQEVVSSATATLAYLKRILPPDNKVYVVGSESLRALLSSAGFDLLPEEARQGAAAVVVGLDPEINHQKLANAGLLIRAGARFIATNTDATYPTPWGLFPGAGVMVAAIQTASGKEPEIIGKPNAGMYFEALERMGLPASAVMGIGDRLETDIAGAQQAGCLAGLVLTGVSTLEQAQRWTPAPDWVAPSLTELIYG
jgi:4-nitrophenyl phosphatase